MQKMIFISFLLIFLGAGCANYDKRPGTDHRDKLGGTEEEVYQKIQEQDREHIADPDTSTSINLEVTAE